MRKHVLFQRRTRPMSLAPAASAGQFVQPYGPMGPPTFFTIPVLRYVNIGDLTHETVAMVSVVQREWTGKSRAPPSGRRSRPRMCRTRGLALAYPFRHAVPSRVRTRKHPKIVIFAWYVGWVDERIGLDRYDCGFYFSRSAFL